MTPHLRDLLAREGPLPLARVLWLASQHYYATREPFGRGGDFVTAPEISQMFGELIGLSLADLWHRAGRSDPLLLVELGPGRGTLMADALRAIGRAAPDFRAAVRLHLVERSERLRAIQKERLEGAVWHDSIATLPTEAPLLLVANEFLDALPIAQFEKLADGWVLRRVTAQGHFDRSVGANLAFIPDTLRNAAPGSVYERNFAAEQLAADLAARIGRQGGAALILDYGYEGPVLGDTLQAIHQGRFADPLATLGEADISAHVDFGAVRMAAGRHALVAGPVAQGEYLQRLGIDQRAETLRRGASIERAAAIEAARVRLTAPAAMGALFKALAIHAPGWPAPAGFSTAGE